MPAILQTYDDYLEDVLSLDIPPDAAVVNDKPISSASMFDFLVKEEPLCEDDLRALQKDRQKKDNHNMSRFLDAIASLESALSVGWLVGPHC